MRKKKKRWWKDAAGEGIEPGIEAAAGGCCLFQALSVVALFALAGIPLLVF